jgi:Fe-S-cluster containining protein
MPQKVWSCQTDSRGSTIIRNYRAWAVRAVPGHVFRTCRGSRQVESLRQLTLKTSCESCMHKCCSQPYDWVFLTQREILLLQSASGLPEHEFVTVRRNPRTGHEFKTLNLPCQFLNEKTGDCTVYGSRPLVCRIFPFYLEPMTGHATLLPIQCGSNLHILPSTSQGAGWKLSDFEAAAQEWAEDLWKEAVATQK